MIRIDLVRENLLEIIKRHNISQARLAKEAGLSARQVWNILHGKTKDIKYETLQKLADALKVRVSDITGESEEIQKEKEVLQTQKETIKKILDQLTGINISNIEPIPKPTTPIPIYGRIPAGTPREVWQDYIEEYIEVTDAPKGSFGLKISGDSMIGAGIEDGDIVIISPMLDIINGDIVVAKIDGTDYTLKRFIKQDNLIILQPANDKYKPIILTEEQANERVVVLGIATGVYRRIRRGRNSGTDK